MNITYNVVEKYPEERFNDLVKRNLESEGIFIPAWEHYQNGDAGFELKGKTVRIAAYHNENLIGLSWGRAETKNRFMMNMSLVEKPYRGIGIYKKMLDLLLENTKEFDEIDSIHHIFNNKIIALKLKKNFYIVGLDQSTMLGPRIRLRFFNNPKIFKIMQYRVGLVENPL